MQRLPFQITDAQIATLVETVLKRLKVSVKTRRNDTDTANIVGNTDIAEISVTFNDLANEEVTVANPLQETPTRVILASAPDRALSWFKGDTWSEETLGFKVNVDTSSVPLTLVFWIR